MARPFASLSTPFRSPLQTRSGLLAVVVDLLLDWQERARSRVLLGRLDDRMLRDIGITRADVDHEAAKPFWRA